MAKMVISLVIESDETGLKDIREDLLQVFGRNIVNMTWNELEEPKKELKIPAFMCNSNYQKILNK